MTFGYVTDFPEDQRNDATSLVDSLARRVGGEARADTVFGDPVIRGDVTVIPVAKVNWAFGGGSGAGGDDGGDSEDFGQGGGGAGAVSAKPLGFIEIKNSRAEFRPMKDRARLWPVIAASGFAVWMGLRGLRALRR
ncbi:MAG: spore germination protein GerW family protein [Dehalococcoidia bacterium]